MNRYDIINKLIQRNNYNKYLEIGTQRGQCFELIDIEYKICVDPVKLYSGLTHEMTSDEFFKNNVEKFDIIFIDGLHLEHQSTLDINNALNCLTDGGVIIVHDCLPHCEEFTKVCWNGTVYKSIIDLRYSNKNLSIQVVDTDNGCGIIKKGKQKLYGGVDIEIAKSYNYYNENRKKLMAIITPAEFIQKYCS